MTDRRVPYEHEAEMALLGAAMISTQAFEAAVTAVETQDFYVPTHGAIHSAIVRLHKAGLPRIDTLIVWDELQAYGEFLEGHGGPAYLLELEAKTPQTSNVHKYATMIVEAATLRDLIRVGGEVASLGYESTDAAMAVDTARSLLGNVDLPVGQGDPSPDIDTFLETEIEYNWLVPGLIERQDRLLLTGGEGMGKSTWFRQVAMCLSAGIHPFQFHPVEPCKVLYVDIENTQAQIQRKMRPLRAMIERRYDPGNLRFETQTGGIDITTRHDHRWLLERVGASEPDVLIIGPVYKLHAGDPNDELPARKVIAALDSIRQRFGCALFMEAHSPHGSATSHGGRPFGASIWKRWPEFGYGIWPIAGDESGAVGFTPWRGARDARDWPTRLVRGNEGMWPWVDPDHHAPEERF